jgi:hypothetical protein
MALQYIYHVILVSKECKLWHMSNMNQPIDALAILWGWMSIVKFVSCNRGKVIIMQIRFYLCYFCMQVLYLEQVTIHYSCFYKVLEHVNKDNQHCILIYGTKIMYIDCNPCFEIMWMGLSECIFSSLILPIECDYNELVQMGYEYNEFARLTMSCVVLCMVQNLNNSELEITWPWNRQPLNQ